jgi:hypothetical protein
MRWTDGIRGGRYDFALVLRTLREIGYQGWVSVEVFHFEPSGEVIAREAAAVRRRIEAGVVAFAPFALRPIEPGRRRLTNQTTRNSAASP